MIYVERDQDGNIIGVFRHPQQGYAEEAITEDDPSVVQFLAAVDAE